MTWKEFKAEVERQGVKDESTLSNINWWVPNRVEVRTVVSAVPEASGEFSVMNEIEEDGFIDDEDSPVEIG